MSDNVLTEELFEEFVEDTMKMLDKNYNLSWDRHHPPVSPTTATRIKNTFKTHCPFCNLTWEKCREWREKDKNSGG